nr:cytochrome P450 4C1-like [Neodiprion pinetum]
MNKVLEADKIYSSPFRVSIGNLLFFVTTDPEQLKLALFGSKTVEKGSLFDFARPWIGSGLVTAPYSTWQVHRKLIQPTFGPTILKSFLEIFVAESVMVADQMECELNGPEFEVSNYFSRCTMGSLCKTVMGVKLDAYAGENNPYVKAFRKVTAGIVRRGFSPWIHPDFIFYRTKLGKDQQKYIKFMHDFTEKLISTKKKQLLERGNRESNEDAEDDRYNTATRREAFLDHIIKLSEHTKILTDEEIRDQVHTFMATGSLSTSDTIGFVMLMLASHPCVQEKVYEELCEIYGDGNGDAQLNVTQEAIARMTYLERVIKETLRLFPAVPLIVREVSEDLDIGGRSLPKGSTMVLNILGVQRSEKYWLDPLKFDPDRFLPENFAKQPQCSYIPFGGGPRNCIAQKYAMLLAKTLVATLLRRYVLTHDKIVQIKDIRIKFEVVLLPVEPITIGIKRRT